MVEMVGRDTCCLMKICKTTEKLKGKNKQRGERKFIDDPMIQLTGIRMMMRSIADTAEKLKGESRKGEVMISRMELKRYQKAETVEITGGGAMETLTARRRREIIGGPSLIGIGGRITTKRMAEIGMMMMRIGKEGIGGEHCVSVKAVL